MAIRMHMPKLASVRGQTLLTDNKPYLYRQSPVVAEMLDDMLTGGTVAVNQFLQNSNVANTVGKHGLTYTRGDNGFSYTLTGTYVYTSGDRNIYSYIYSPSIPVIEGHVYLVTTTSKYFQPYLYGVTWSMARSYLHNTPTGGVVGRASTSGNINMSTHCGSNIPNNTDINETVYQNLIDLTQMFGSTIADYIYSLEIQTAGSGIAFLKSFGFFTKDFYPYDAGSLLSVQTSGHETAKGGITHTYPLSDIELRGIPKLDASNNLYYDGDTYASDGTVTRRMASVDLGTLTWNADPNRVGVYYTSIPSKQVGEYLDPAKNGLVCTRYAYNNIGVTTSIDKYISDYPSYGGKIVFARDTAYASASDFKTAMNGVILWYYLETPTTEITDAFENPQISGTTEEYVDTRAVSMPVGHSTQYFDMVQMEKVQMHMPNNQPIKMHMPTNG